MTTTRTIRFIEFITPIARLHELLQGGEDCDGKRQIDRVIVKPTNYQVANNVCSIMPLFSNFQNISPPVISNCFSIFHSIVTLLVQFSFIVPVFIPAPSRTAVTFLLCLGRKNSNLSCLILPMHASSKKTNAAKSTAKLLLDLVPIPSRPPPLHHL